MVTLKVEEAIFNHTALRLPILCNSDESGLEGLEGPTVLPPAAKSHALAWVGNLGFGSGSGGVRWSTLRKFQFIHISIVKGLSYRMCGLVSRAAQSSGLV